MRRFHAFLSAVALLAVCSISFALEPDELFSVWPGRAPDETREAATEKRVLGRRRPFYQITDISQPTVSVFLPPKERRTGAAILVCPGGALQRLAYEHEGLEVAEWLTLGDIAAFVLKYRVPGPATTGLKDAQRALSLIRARASEWGVDPENVGVLGFSAGGEIAAWLATHHKERQYETVDASDAFPCRPDFAALIYPGGLVTGRTGQIKEQVASRINAETPPMFFAHAFDDSCENSLLMMLALKRARVPSELHLFQTGGHAFGVRETGAPVGNWKLQFAEWMKSQGFLDPSFIRAYVREFSEALKGNGQLPKLAEKHPNASLEDGYITQRRQIQRALRQDQIAGFKAAAISAEAQKNLGIDQPLTGVLLRSGQLMADKSPVVQLTANEEIIVETEIGYIISVDISYKLYNDEQAQGAVEAIVPAIELPANYARRIGTMSAIDMVASNVGSRRFIVGARKDPDAIDPSRLKIVLKRDGKILHEAAGGATRGEHWTKLRELLNQITSRGCMIPAGSVIISGARGTIHPGEAGKHEADFGELGTIAFELRR